MAVVIRLQGLPMVAGTMDIRHFFSGLTIPDGGVHIVGGEQGEAFIVFGTDEDARLGMMRTGGAIKNSKVSLLLSSKTEMQNMIELSRRRFESGATAAAAETASAAAPAISAGNGSRQGVPAQVQGGGGSGGRGGSHNQTSHSNQGFGNVQASVSQANVAHDHQGSKPAVSLVNMMPSFSNAHSTGPPPIPPIPSIPSMPPITSLPSMAGPPPGSTLPPVPTVSPLSQGPHQHQGHHVPPMSHLHQHMSSMPPFNPSLPPPAGLGSGLPLGTPGPMLFNPLNHLNPLASLGLQAHMKAAAAASAAAGPINPDEVFVLLQNLPFTCTEGDIREFFRGLAVEGVRLIREYGNQGRPSGKAIVKFYSRQDCFEAVKRGGAMMGQRFIEIVPATERQWASLDGNAMTTPAGPAGPASHGNSNINLKPNNNQSQPQDQHRGRSTAPSSGVGGGGGDGREQRPRSRSPFRKDLCVYLKGLPYEVQKKQIQEFFKNLDIVEESIYIAYGPQGRATGEGFLEFRVEQDYKTALGSHMQYMGSRFIQVHPISKKGMLEKIDSIRKRSTPGDGKQQQDGPKPPRNCAHITNIPYNVSRKDVRSFLEGVGIYEDSLKILTDSHGNGLGQAVFQLRTEEDGRKAERLHRQKLNGRDAFVHLVTYEQMKEIERNPPPQSKRGQQRNNQQPNQSPGGQNQIQNPTGQNQNQLAPQPPMSPINPFAAMTGEELHFLRSTMGNLNSPGPFLSPFSAPGGGLAGPPPLPALAATLGGDMGGLGMPPSLVAGLPGGPLLEPPAFRPGFGAPFGQESLRGLMPFNPADRKGGAGPGAGPQNRAGAGGANANQVRPVGGANLQPNNPGNPAGNPGNQRGNGAGSGPGNLSGGGGPFIVKLQNMPFTVTADEILDFFYGYQVLPGSVLLQTSEKGHPTGEAMVAFQAQQEAAAAVLELNDRPIGARKVKISLG